MPASGKPSGWRKASAELTHDARLAREGQGAAAPRTRCLVAIKRVGVHLGLKPADLLLLDTLSAFTQPQDWLIIVKHLQRNYWLL